MYTQCPECMTIYKVAPDTLAQGHGSVTCGHCTAVFDALRTLTENLPSERTEQLDAHQSAGDLPQLTTPVLRPAAPNGTENDLFAQAERPAKAVSPHEVATPGFVRSRALAPSPPKWPWRVGIALLVPVLAAQIAYAERHALLRNALARPWLDRACASLGCQLPLQHDADDLVLLSRDVRPHPSVPNALIISATLRNAAKFPQAFPTVEITLADLDEHRIAMRRFLPAEYVGDTRTIAAGLAPGASSALVFEVADPGKNAVAYEFKFL